MQIRPVFTLSPQAGPSPAASAALFTPGETVTAQVVEVKEGQVMLRLQEGALLIAKAQATQPLQVGDVVVLLASNEQSMPDGLLPRLELLSVNGQPLKAGVASEEYALLRIQVSPSKTNLNTADILRQMGAPVRAETFAKLDRLFARFPMLEPDVAVLLAASALPIDTETVSAFREWLQSPASAADFAATIEALAIQDPQAGATLETAARALQDIAEAATITPQAALPGEVTFEARMPSPLPLFSALEASPAWPALREYALTLPENEARALMAQLTSALLPEMAESLPEASALLSETSALLTDSIAQSRDALSEALYSRYIQPAQAQPSPEQAEAAMRPSLPLPQMQEEQALHTRSPDTQPLRPTEAQTMQLPLLKSALESLFAKLPVNQSVNGDGDALAKAAAGLLPKLRALTAALEPQQETNSAAQKAALLLGQTLTRQVQMGGELGNILYLPLPVVLNAHRQDAELYVLKRNGGAGKLDESNITVAVCLGTLNLGRVEALVQVVHNDITLQLRVQNAQQREFFEDRLAQINALAFPLPYRLRGARVVLQDAPITPLNAGQTLLSAFALPTQGGLDISI